MKILFLVNTPTNYTGHTVEIDRPDLTRRLDCVNTWVPDILAAGHEVLFYVGGAEKNYYDEELMTLHLKTEAGYDTALYGQGTSVIFKKNQAAYRWILENRTFDVVFSGEDDMYINLPEFVKILEDYNFINTADCMTTHALGGGGFILSRRALEVLAEYNNTEYHVADLATYYALESSGQRIINHMRTSPFYFPAELYGMMHYIVGKKVYLLHHTLKYFREHGYTNRKIILGSPLDTMKLNDLITYETTARKRTVRWYDFTTDPFNWEYHCGYPNSTMFPVSWMKQFWPFAERATKYFVLDFKGMIRDTPFGTDQFFDGLDFYVTNCRRSLINPDNLILCSSGQEELPGWKINNTVKTSLNLTFEHLEHYNFYTQK